MLGVLTIGCPAILKYGRADRPRREQGNWVVFLIQWGSPEFFFGCFFSFLLLRRFPTGLWPRSHRGHLAGGSLFGHVPPVQQGTQFLHQLWVLWGEVCFFSRILFEIEKLGFPSLWGILHFPGRAVVGQKELVVPLDYPTVKKGCLRVFDIGNVMSERLSEEGISFDLLSALEMGRRLSPGKSCGPLAPAAANTVGTKSSEEHSSGRSAGGMVPFNET